MSALDSPGATTCPHCGTRNPPGANFCNRCGAALAGDLESAPVDPAAPLPESGFQADAHEQGAVTGMRPEQPVDAAPGAVVEQVEEGELDTLLESSETNDSPADTSAPAMELVSFPDEQLLGGGPGYLESLPIIGDAAAPATSDDRPPARPTGADNEHWRMLRSLLRDEPVLATAAAAGPSQPNYRPLWITLLILVAALTPFVFDGMLANIGAPRVAPGLVRAFDTIGNLKVDDEVLVFWQADPATTSEMNVVALPVVSQLLERGARSIVVSGVPAGVAAARRLYGEATRGMDSSVMETVLVGWEGTGIFLSGGTAALPLIAGDSARLLSFKPTSPPAPQLALVVAPQAEDVQRWLEIVQPVNRLQVVAVTAAGAEPILQPYVESGQLAGLVSGFDGATAFQALRSEALGPEAQRKQMLAVGVQNGGAVALLIILAAGNMARLFRRERRG